MANWCKFERNLFEMWFYTYFFLYMLVALGQGQITSLGQSFDVGWNLLSLWPTGASFENKSDWTVIFYMYITLEHGR